MKLSPSTKRAVAVKSMMWSSNGYDGPSGAKVIGGFVSKHGFGAEEWNGRANRVWESQRVFHTETKPKLDLYAEQGNLGLVMIAMHKGVQYVVGVACAVRANAPEELSSIFKMAEFNDTIHELWSTETVRRRYNSLKALKLDFPNGFDAPRWRCPSHLYHWFEQPIPLKSDPLGFGKRVLLKMHNNYQAIRPDDAITLLGGRLPPSSPIIQWFQNQDFDEAFLPEYIRNKTGQNSSKRDRESSAPAAKDPYKRYIEDQEINVTPRHHLLETQFLKFLQRKGARSIICNEKAIDMHFEFSPHGHVVAELKPAEEGETKYPIRFAIGQVLEYCHFQFPKAKPLIVLGAEPKMKEIEFCHSLGINLAWKTESSFSFAWKK